MVDQFTRYVVSRKGLIKDKSSSYVFKNVDYAKRVCDRFNRGLTGLEQKDKNDIETYHVYEVTIKFKKVIREN